VSDGKTKPSTAANGKEMENEGRATMPMEGKWIYTAMEEFSRKKIIWHGRIYPGERMLISVNRASGTCVES